MVDLMTSIDWRAPMRSLAFFQVLTKLTRRPQKKLAIIPFLDIGLLRGDRRLECGLLQERKEYMMTMSSIVGVRRAPIKESSKLRCQ